MAAMDDGIANLQRFVANLTVADGALETITQHLQETARDFAQLEQDANDHGGGLNDDLEELRSKLDAEEQEARAAIDEVAHAATDAQGRLGEVEDRVTQAASHFEEKAHTISSDLDQDHAQLSDQGFTVLGHTLDEDQQQLEGARQESEQAFKELEGAVQGFETEAQAAWDAGDAALQDATSDLADQEAGLVTQVSGATQAFDSAASDLDGFCSTLEGDIGTIYDGFAAAVDAAGEELAQAVQSLMQEAVGFVEAGKQGRLDEPADTLEEDALGLLGEEYGALHASLDLAAATAAELEPLADELVKCQAVVGEIDRLLNAVAE